MVQKLNLPKKQEVTSPLIRLVPNLLCATHTELDKITHAQI